ncbi:PorV/PorQ family protein [Candidatus Margulisiibacteriota bacterium]
MVRSRLITSLILITLVCSAAFAANENTGTKQFAFVKLQKSVRAAGMAGTYVAIADDASATLLNPAGLVLLQSNAIQLTYNNWLAGTSYSNLIYANYLGRSGVVSGSITYLGFGDIAETTRALPGGTGSNFSSSGMEYSVSYGRLLSPTLSIGVTLKNVQQSIGSTGTSSLAGNLGVLWDSPWNVKLGGVLKDVGGSLPSETCLGVSSRFLDNKLIVGGELALPADNASTIHLGVEYNFSPLLTLRSGYNTRSEEKAGGKWSLGLGLNWRTFHVDYAYVPYEELGTTHRLGLKFDI